MYKILALVKSGKDIGYVVKYTLNNKITLWKREIVVNEAMSGRVEDVIVTKSGVLRGTNGFRLGDLEVLSIDEYESWRKKNILDDEDIIVLRDKKLYSYIKSKLMAENINKPRKVFEQFKWYLDNDSYKICTLCGLRRTGKSILMLQGARYLIQRGFKVAYIECLANTSMRLLNKSIRDLIDKGYRYLFIDEITYINEFIGNSHGLSDIYGYENDGVKIVITGTHSCVLSMAEKLNLFDRIYRIDTSYISFSESKELGITSDIIQYIMGGGTFSNSLEYAKEHRIIEKGMVGEEINEYIVDNLVQSLKKNSETVRYRELTEAVEIGIMSRLINQTIEHSNEEININMLRKVYKNTYFGKSRNNIKQLKRKDGMSAEESDICNYIDKDMIMEHYTRSVNIVKRIEGLEANDYYKYLGKMIEMLIDIGVMTKYNKIVKLGDMPEFKGATLVYQPALRYSQILKLINSISSTIPRVRSGIIKEFINNLLYTGQGDILEEIVLIDEIERHKARHNGIDNTWRRVTFSYSDEDIVSQITVEMDDRGKLVRKEIDVIVIENNKAYLYEVKRSAEISSEQYRWLIDKEFNREISESLQCEIVSRVVLYRGNNCEQVVDGIKIEYRNVEEFLSR